jgi:magnesium chelatase subunit D
MIASFSQFVGQQRAKLALLLNAVDPRCGGVLFVGERGCGKSTLARCLPSFLSENCPFVEMPLNATEEAITGGIDFEQTIRSGKRHFLPSLLRRAENGFLYIDDVNLLPEELLTLVLHHEASESLSGDELQAKRQTGFRLIASMTPDAPLSPHALDRFGMAVFWKHIDEKEPRCQIVQLAEQNQARSITDPRDVQLQKSISQARNRLAAVRVPAAIEELIAERCMSYLVAGHRGDIFLYYGARAYAALMGKNEVSEDDLEIVLPLVLEHRQRRAPENEQQQQQNKEQAGQNSKEQRENHSTHKPEHEQSDDQQSEQQQQEEHDQDASRTRVSLPREQVFDIGETFAVRRFQFRRDRVKRGSSGRKVRTLSKDKRGRYVKSAKRGAENDIAIDATIRAAAPWQHVRGAHESLLIRPEDILYKQREKRIGHTTVFVVDGSGSMGAQNRMRATKGAIQSLLLDSYQKRDKVAMIVFRRDHAELVLPPTSSSQRAACLLQQIPVGGKTPLSAGLWTACQLIERAQRRNPEARFLMTLISDCKANQSMTDATPAEEVNRAVASLRELPSTEFMVVDTENSSSFVRTGSARIIATLLEAQYFAMDTLEAENLAALFRTKSG